MGQKHTRFRESRTSFPLRDIHKNPRSMYARAPQAMAQFVLKIEKLSHIMGPTPILEMARAYGLRPRLWLLVMINIVTVEYPPSKNKQKKIMQGTAEAVDGKNKFLQDVKGPASYHFSNCPSLNRILVFQDDVGNERGSYVFNSLISVSF